MLPRLSLASCRTQALYYACHAKSSLVTFFVPLLTQIDMLVTHISMSVTHLKHLSQDFLGKEKNTVMASKLCIHLTTIVIG